MKLYIPGAFQTSVYKKSKEKGTVCVMQTET